MLMATLTKEASVTNEIKKVCMSARTRDWGLLLKNNNRNSGSNCIKLKQ